MTLFAFHKKMSPGELQAAADKTKPEIAAWFAANPKRRVCNAQLWYNKPYKIRRKTINEDLDAAVKEQLASEVASGENAKIIEDILASWRKLK